jgi:hypothetical protein
MSTDTDPDPAFLDHLEWQLRTELRREARFAPREAAPMWKRLKIAALVAASLALGGASVVAAERVQQSREAEILAAQTRVRIDLQRSRTDLAAQRLSEASTRVQAGIATQAEVGRAEVARALEQMRLRRLELDLSELELSGREPRDELDAPLVAGQDFVTERMQVELEAARARLAEVQRAHAWVERMVAGGFASHDELDRILEDAVEPQQQTHALEELLALRGNYLSGSLQRERAWIFAQRVRASAALEGLRVRIELARARLERTETRSAAGAASNEDVENARQSLLELESESRLTQLELERLQLPN